MGPRGREIEVGCLVEPARAFELEPRTDDRLRRRGGRDDERQPGGEAGGSTAKLARRAH